MNKVKRRSFIGMVIAFVCGLFCVRPKGVDASEAPLRVRPFIWNHEYVNGDGVEVRGMFALVYGKKSQMDAYEKAFLKRVTGWQVTTELAEGDFELFVWPTLEITLLESQASQKHLSLACEDLPFATVVEPPRNYDPSKKLETFLDHETYYENIRKQRLDIAKRHMGAEV